MEAGGDKQHMGICLIQTDRSANGLNLKNCVLLDSESTVYAFCNDNLLQNVWATDEIMTVVGNGGTMTTSTVSVHKRNMITNTTLV